MTLIPLMLMGLSGCPVTNPPTDTAPPQESDTDTDPDTDVDSDTDLLSETPMHADLFTASPYDSLRIVVHYRPGAEPRAGGLLRLRNALDELEASGHIDKPGGITVELGTALAASPDPDAVRTFEELDADLESVRGPYVDGSTAVIHGLYTDGGFGQDDGNSQVLGFAYQNVKFVMMKDNIDEACDQGGLLDLLGIDAPERACAVTEAAVLLHELGHLFGLVDNGLPMVVDHSDAPDHPNHDADSDCLMYWAADTPTMGDVIAQRFLDGNEAIPPFGPDCLADLEAAHGPD